MDKLNFVFLIREDNYWEQLFSHIGNLNKQSTMINKIAVVTVGTAILSYLESTHMELTKYTFTRLSNESVEFHLCGNTLFRYGIDEDMLLPEIAVAHEGGLLKAAHFEAMRYHTITLG